MARFVRKNKVKSGLPNLISNISKSCDKTTTTYIAF